MKLNKKSHNLDKIKKKSKLVKNDNEINAVRESCKIAAFVLDQLITKVSAGVNTYDLDQEGRRLIEECKASSACYNYFARNHRFPAYTCISINDEVVHGIGRLDRVINSGDIVTVDVVVHYNGYIGDNAKTVAVGEISEEVQFLLETTEEALYRGIDKARAGNRVGDISNAIQIFTESRNFSVVKDFVGHGVGRSMHEDPQIPNFGKRNTGIKLVPGMTLAIEPMINMGNAEIEIANDGWTAITKDHKPSAHFEHTILITKENAEILTTAEK